MEPRDVFYQHTLANDGQSKVTLEEALWAVYWCYRVGGDNAGMPGWPSPEDPWEYLAELGYRIEHNKQIQLIVGLDDIMEEPK